MDWNYLKIIDAVALTGNLSRAAKLIKVDTSTLSRQLQKFEQECQFKVFKRSGNQMITSTEGQLWVHCAQQVKSQIDNLWLDQKSKTRTLTVTFIEIFLNHYILPRASHFQTKLECIGSDRNMDLARREADIAIRFGRPIAGNYVIQKLFDAGHAIYVRREFRKDLPADARKCPWVSLNETFNEIADRTWFRQNIGDDRIQYKVSSCEQLLPVLKNNAVIGILPCYMGDQQSELVRFASDQIIFERTAWLVLHSDIAQQKHIREFVQELKTLVKRDAKILRG